jgi:hypothetical protein
MTTQQKIIKAKVGVLDIGEAAWQCVKGLSANGLCLCCLAETTGAIQFVVVVTSGNDFSNGLPSLKWCCRSSL